MLMTPFLVQAFKIKNIFLKIPQSQLPYAITITNSNLYISFYKLMKQDKRKGEGRG